MKQHLYKHCCHNWEKAKYGMSDKQRFEWERQIWNYIRQIYKAVFKQKLPLLPEPTTGIHIKDKLSDFEIEKIEDLVSRINIEKAIKQLYKEK